MIFNIDDIIPFSKRHPRKTIREILTIDSGYIKDLLRKNSNFVLSEKCIKEAMIITKGMYEKQVKPTRVTDNVFDSCKTYGIPYDFDFNDVSIIGLNKSKLDSLKDDDLPF